MKLSVVALIFTLTLLSGTIAFPPTAEEQGGRTCRRTKVAILGGGCAGIFAAQALHNASVDDFIIVEYNDKIGGRVRHSTFGQQPNGLGPYTIELGANWVQGLVSKGGPENPVWTLAKKWSLRNKFSNYENITTYDQTGETDYTYIFDEFEDAYVRYEQAAGRILSQKLQDRSSRTGFRMAGWEPSKDHRMKAVEWFDMDFEYAQRPEELSHLFSVTSYNATFYQYSDHNNFVIDPRGYNALIYGEASTFLKDGDLRLLLNTIVTDIAYSDSGVTIHTEDDRCIQADYAICTFSIGVLQHDKVKFFPKLPAWKQTGISGMKMTTYTKIFLQFAPEQVFWDTDTQFHLYADPFERGYYPIWQSLDTPGFFPGSGIILVTIVQDQSHVVEAQSEEQTKYQVLRVLRDMFPGKTIPEPIAFMYPRWGLEPWAHGSFSYWPPGYTLEMHQNLRANVGRLWFAGEATSAEYYSFLHGAYFEGQRVGQAIAGCINDGMTACTSSSHYDLLHQRPE